MKISLDSDFRDFYDYWFEAKSLSSAYQTKGFSLTLHRKMRDGIGKAAQFQVLDKIGFQVPKHGRLKGATFEADFPGDRVVLYIDIYAHAGEGKFLMRKDSVAQCYFGYFASEFIPTTANSAEESISYRMLAIGHRIFWLKYSSNEWASNRGDVQVELVDDQMPAATAAAVLRTASNGFNFEPLAELPIFAIDLVCRHNSDPNAAREFYAVDLNSAPGLSRTPIEDMFSGSDVCNLIKEYVSNQFR